MIVFPDDFFTSTLNAILLHPYALARSLAGIAVGFAVAAGYTGAVGSTHPLCILAFQFFAITTVGLLFAACDGGGAK